MVVSPVGLTEDPFLKEFEKQQKFLEQAHQGMTLQDFNFGSSGANSPTIGQGWSTARAGRGNADLFYDN